MGSTIAEAQKKMDQTIKLGKCYRIEWAGEFENQVRATKRLTQVVPVSLVIIVILLFITFGNGKGAALVLANVPFALIGGIAALHITGVNFSISAGIGSETQKPLAIVVIGGLMTATVLTVLIFPLIFAFFYREMHQDGLAHKRVEKERPVLVGA